jgi:hypothetical protein
MPDCSRASLVRRWHASGSQRGDHGQDGLPFAEWLALTGRARDHVPGPVAAIGAPYRAFMCRLQLKLDGQLASFRRGDHLLDVEKQPLPTLTAVGACASKRPTAGGNIGRRRRADLVAQDFDLRLAMRLLRFGGHGGGSAHREKLSGRDAETCGLYRWLRGDGLPEGFQILCLSCKDSKGHGRTVHARAYRQQEAPLCL